MEWECTLLKLYLGNGVRFGGVGWGQVGDVQLDQVGNVELESNDNPKSEANQHDPDQYPF